MEIHDVQALIAEKVPLAAFLGITVESAEYGHVRLKLPFSKNVQNHLEIVYAGAMFALAEIAGGVAMMSVFDTTKYTILIERLNIEFQRPSRRDLWCDLTLTQDLIDQVHEKVKSEGKVKMSLPIEVRDERHRLIACVEGAYYIRRAKSSS